LTLTQSELNFKDSHKYIGYCTIIIVFLNKVNMLYMLHGHNILTEGVFVTQLSSNAGISVLRNCEGYEKLLFNERCNVLGNGTPFRSS
jgi:hypothetical protein